MLNTKLRHCLRNTNQIQLDKIPSIEIKIKGKLEAIPLAVPDMLGFINMAEHKPMLKDKINTIPKTTGGNHQLPR